MAPEEQDLPAQSLNEPISLFPDSGVPASDDAPTIISKNQQSRNGSSHEALLNGSLRGRTLAHFELIEPIGVGGMAAVIRARDKHLDRPVALKILPPEMAADPENVRRFHQEARAAAKLDHENIARVFFCGEDQRLHFIAFEFVEGLNLRHLLERRGRLPVPEAVHYMLQIATGLAHAASRGVVHRDIKPSNIIISPNGRAKLVDMGLARHLGPHDDKALTQSGVTLGTFDYIAPEQAMDPRDADVRSDIYSLGCTFYHMLTGQPPVPEGTAAKKLHHHQHVAPVDPRQLNPDIPDDVAAVLVRMMAKDPKDRYQRAEHLVQHLLQVAQKLGASTDLPDGVLFVDAPLPTPPRKRPLLTVALAILGLGLVLLVLSFAPGPNRVRPTRNPQAPAEVKSTPTVEKTPVQDQKKEVEPPPLAGSRKIITSERELREALADTTNHLHLLLDVKDISITKVGLLIRGRSDRTIVIESKDKEPKNWATLHITPGQALDGKPWAGLELQGGIVTFRNLRFELDARETPKSLLAGVLVKGARQVIFKDCTFVQPNVPLLPLIRRQGLTPIASVAALNPDETSDEKPRLEFEECYFERGQTAVALVSAADVIAVNCAFGDHVALFHLRGQGNTRPRSKLDLRNISAFLVHGPAFRVDNDARCVLTVTHSIFSCPDVVLDRDPTDLIRQTNADPNPNPTVPPIRFEGRRNGYHKLQNFVMRSGVDNTEVKYDTYDRFKTFLVEVSGRDLDSNVLTADPWASQNPLLQQKPQVAFAINPNMAELRDKTNQGVAIGVRQCTWGEVNKDLPDLQSLRPPIPVALPKLKPNEKIVDPASDGTTAGVYRNIQAAVLEAGSPDVVVLIRHTGVLAVNPITLKKDQQVTVRPYEGHRPILTLNTGMADADAALFTLYHGQLRFENLEFHLQTCEGFDSRTIVAVHGNGLCSFKQCVLTLERADKELVPPTVVSLVESKEAKKMPSADGRTRPEIRLQDCFVRGDGDLLAARPNRPFDLDVSAALVALSGSLVNTDGSAPELQVKLTRVTTYLGEHLLNLRGVNGSGPSFTQGTATDCLFAAAGSKAMIYLDGPDGEEQMRRVFGWEAKSNVYSGYDNLLEQPQAAMMGSKRRDRTAWQRLFPNDDGRFVQITFEKSLTERVLSQAVPEDFRGGQGAGVTIEQLPRPAAPLERPRPPEGPNGDE